MAQSSFSATPDDVLTRFLLGPVLPKLPQSDKWPKRLTDADRRALAPLFWTPVNPYGRFEPDRKAHLDLAAVA
ncbi:hypothetical protein [Streptomyces sp. DSM 118878]